MRSAIPLALAFVGILAIGDPTSIAQPPGPARPRQSRPASRPKAKVIRGDGWAMAAPDDWGRFPGVRPPMVLYLIGDAQKGIPPRDGTLSALKAGLTVEVFPAGGRPSARERADKDLEDLERAAGIEIVGMPAVDEITLADGTKAVRVKVDLARPRERRISFYEKVYCALPDDRHAVGTTFVTCSPGGGAFVRKAGVIRFAEAHAESLVLDAAKLGPARWEAAYKALDLRVGEALRKTREGNDLLTAGANDRAAKACREALDLCDYLAAAHNDLAWALLQDRKDKDLAEAVQHAEAAVELTARRDANSLGTLSLAYSRKGDRAKAIATIREALKLDPQDAELKGSLDTYEKGSPQD